MEKLLSFICYTIREDLYLRKVRVSLVFCHTRKLPEYFPAVARGLLRAQDWRIVVINTEVRMVTQRVRPSLAGRLPVSWTKIQRLVVPASGHMHSLQRSRVTLRCPGMALGTSGLPGLDTGNPL